MAAPFLLTLPIEVRTMIYGYVNQPAVVFVSGNVTQNDTPTPATAHRLREPSFQRLRRVCRQINHELINSATTTIVRAHKYAPLSQIPGLLGANRVTVLNIAFVAKRPPRDGPQAQVILEGQMGVAPSAVVTLFPNLETFSLYMLYPEWASDWRWAMLQILAEIVQGYTKFGGLGLVPDDQQIIYSASNLQQS